MERNTIDEMIEICQALKDGKEIELYGECSREWRIALLPPNFRDFRYRIKPEEPKKKWRPFRDVDEFIKAVGGLGAIWLKRKADDFLQLVSALAPNSFRPIRLVNYWVTFDELFENCTFADGTPCGVEEDAQ